MNRITVVALDDLPAGVLEELEPYLHDGTVDTMELTRRYCLDCGIRWRSPRHSHSAETERVMANVYRNSRVHWSYREAGYE